MAYATGEAPVLAGDRVGRDGQPGTVTEVRGEDLVVALSATGTAVWPASECRLLVPVPGTPLRPRPGWTLPWNATFGHTATEYVEKSGVYIRRTEDERFLVVDNRDARFQDRLVTARPGTRTIDEAYEIGEATLAEVPLLDSVAKEVKAAHDIVREVTGSPVVEGVQFSIELKDRDDGALYDREALRPIEETLLRVARPQLHGTIFTRFILTSERTPLESVG